jgi:hypothetical protein
MAAAFKNYIRFFQNKKGQISFEESLRNFLLVSLIWLNRAQDKNLVNILCLFILCLFTSLPCYMGLLDKQIIWHYSWFWVCGLSTSMAAISIVSNFLDHSRSNSDNNFVTYWKQKRLRIVKNFTRNITLI